MVVCIAGGMEVEESSGLELKLIRGLQNASFLRMEGETVVDMDHSKIVVHQLTHMGWF